MLLKVSVGGLIDRGDEWRGLTTPNTFLAPTSKDIVSRIYCTPFIRPSWIRRDISKIHLQELTQSHRVHNIHCHQYAKPQSRSFFSTTFNMVEAAEFYHGKTWRSLDLTRHSLIFDDFSSLNWIMRVFIRWNSLSTSLWQHVCRVAQMSLKIKR